jgi:hypothetical protein
MILRFIRRVCGWVTFPFSTTNHIQATMAIILALVTTAYVIIAASQLREFRAKTSELTTQVNELKQNDALTQRASLIMRDFSVTPLLIPPTDPPAVPNGVLYGYEAIPHWENVGNTIATDVTTFATYYFSRDELPLNFTASEPKETMQGPITIGPHQTISASAFGDRNGQPTFFPQGCLRDVASGKYRYIYIWGRATYRDVFRPQEIRVSIFCWRVHGIVNVDNFWKFRYNLCDEGNCQDSTCDNYKNIAPPKMPPTEQCSTLIATIHVGDGQRQGVQQPSPPAGAPQPSAQPK